MIIVFLSFLVRWCLLGVLKWLAVVSPPWCHGLGFQEQLVVLWWGMLDALAWRPQIYSNQPRYSTSIHDKFANIVSKSLHTPIVLLFLSPIQNSLFYLRYLISPHRIMRSSMRGFIVRPNNQVDEVVVHSSRIHHPNMLEHSLRASEQNHIRVVEWRYHSPMQISSSMMEQPPGSRL